MTDIISNIKQPGVDIGEPLISIVIPTYNRLSLLQEAIASVKAQTYTNWELIIADDGSTDGTADAIKKMNDLRIQVIALPHTGHISKVINEGAKKTNGEWLAFLDSDDLWAPPKLELQLEVLRNYKTRWVYSGYELIDENKKTIYKSSARFLPIAGKITEEIILTKAGITICSVIVEKKLFDEIGGFSDNPDIRGDYEFTLRMSMKAEAAVAPQPLVFVREHSARITKSRSYPHERTARTYKVFIDQKPGKEFERLARRRLAHLLSEASVQRFAKGENKIALRQISQSLWMRDKPRHWLSALKRGIHAAFKKYFQNTAKKRKAENVAAYNS